MNYSSEKNEACRDVMDRVARHLIREEITISAMESCTGGLFASCLTDTEGVSAVFPGSFVTYSNGAKELCGVPSGIIGRYGVYSAEAAGAMAAACRDFYGTDIGVGITGSTGNADPNNADSVPGEVFYEIRWGQERCARHLNLETDGRTRSEMKERIVGDVARTLAGMLGIEAE